MGCALKATVFGASCPGEMGRPGDRLHPASLAWTPPTESVLLGHTGTVSASAATHWGTRVQREAFTLSAAPSARGLRLPW